MANAVYVKEGTTKIWMDTGGDYALTFSALGAANARVGARGDMGAAPGPRLYEWYLEAEWTSAPTIDGSLDLYFALWDNDTGPASPQGQVPATDTSWTTTANLNKIKNLRFAGPTIIDTSATGLFSASGEIWLPRRYITPVVRNNGSVALKTSLTHYLRLTPLYLDIQ